MLLKIYTKNWNKIYGVENALLDDYIDILNNNDYVPKAVKRHLSTVNC